MRPMRRTHAKSTSSAITPGGTLVGWLGKKKKGAIAALEWTPEEDTNSVKGRCRFLEKTTVLPKKKKVVERKTQKRVCTSPVLISKRPP